VSEAVGGRRYGNMITMSPPLVITRSECDRIVAGSRVVDGGFQLKPFANLLA